MLARSNEHDRSQAARCNAIFQGRLIVNFGYVQNETNKRVVHKVYKKDKFQIASPATVWFGSCSNTAGHN